MARKLIAAAVAIVLLWFGYVGYTNWRNSHSMANGEITSVNDGGAQTSAPAASEPEKPKTTTTTTAAPSSATQPIVIQPSAPPTDSQQPNAVNGARFAGSGKYQVYRQGNITYRIDTETGQECILLATNEEWKKPQVYGRGCKTR
jgi:cytoskeletal protein RodZ